MCISPMRGAGQFCMLHSAVSRKRGCHRYEAQKKITRAGSTKASYYTNCMSFFQAPEHKTRGLGYWVVYMYVYCTSAQTCLLNER